MHAPRRLEGIYSCGKVILCNIFYKYIFRKIIIAVCLYICGYFKHKYHRVGIDDVARFSIDAIHYKRENISGWVHYHAF